MTAAFWNTQVKDNLSFLFAASWPIGSIFTSVVSTNPATLLGFGTWTAFGTGRTLVGIDAGQTEFDVVEETGGAKTHTHSVPSLLVPGLAFTANVTIGSAGYTVIYQSNDHVSGVGDTASGSGTTSAGSTGAGTTGSTSGLPPYQVVYFWKRTA